MIAKRVFDVFFSSILLILLAVPMLVFWIISSINFLSNGLFIQTRIGQYAKPFTIYKYKTLYLNQSKYSKWGSFLRKTKIDELPQLLNILKGDMSFVGPRPDLPGYYDTLSGENKLLLNLKPGLTSEAALKYSNEEQILASQQCAKEYNDKVIYPDKIKMNLHYYYNRNFSLDLKIIFKTVLNVIKLEGTNAGNPGRCETRDDEELAEDEVGLRALGECSYVESKSGRQRRIPWCPSP